MAGIFSPINERLRALVRGYNPQQAPPPPPRCPVVRVVTLTLTKTLDDLCPICLELQAPGAESVVMLVCGHKYHESCIRRWLEEQPTCPVCKKNLLQ